LESGDHLGEAGAIGSFLGYLLAGPSSKYGGQEKGVALLGREAHMRAVRDQGLYVDLGEKIEVLRFKPTFRSYASIP
jgi:hypothetical protein